ncbi:uncharacterized protein KIAA1551 homolog [Carlito syrichta]|uniref:Uncharacterized protein KIAA1551 homolog n=1 Tax=Carlito syrichta TaxID=1868482 RepID=A0A1U7SYU0_CARSF|nr:uncharacterized protein KIAA1551 homolog [Carlito syrichta]
MSWNTKRKSATLPPLYPKSQSSFSQPSLVNQLTTTSQSFFSYPGSNQEACMYPSSSDPASQPLLNIQNYPQQTPVSDMHSGTVMASQTSVERITYANVKGPKPLSHSLQLSSGVTQNVWLNSPVRNSTLSLAGTTISHQMDFETNTPNICAQQNQLVASDTYSMQLQMTPSHPPRVPITYRGNQGLNQCFSEQQVDWVQQYTPNGVSYPEYRPPPKQYCYLPQSFLQDPAIQKKFATPSMSLQGKNNQLPNSALTSQAKQTATVLSQQYAAQTDERAPPPYNCRYRSQPLQSTQHVKHLGMEVPQGPETPASEIRTEFHRGLQQQWQNSSKNVGTVGNFCNLKANSSIKQPFNEPMRSSMDGDRTLAQNNQEKRMDSCIPTSNQVVDTGVTKEKLVRDIKTLVEIKKKFSELARKIKINKDLLVSAGCIKMTNASHRESSQNSVLSLKQTAKVQSVPQVISITPEIAQRQSPTVVESAQTNKTSCMLNSNIQEINCRKFDQVNSGLVNSVCSEKLSTPGQLHNLKVMPSSKSSTAEMTQVTLSNTQLSSENVLNPKQNLPTSCETHSVPHFTLLEEYISKYPNRNTLLLSLLTQGDKTQNKLLEDGSQTIQGSKSDTSVMNPIAKKTGYQMNLKAMDAPSILSVSDKISDNSLCLEHESSTKVMPVESDSTCSMEVLATCLSLWKKQSSETMNEKQQHNSSTDGTAVGIPKFTDVYIKNPCSVVENSQSKMVNPSQETTSSVIVQGYETLGTNITKGTELQIAIVSPLIISEVRTLSVKEITPEALPGTVYPTIKEGSVCSLQNQLTENTTVTAALKADVNVATTATSTKALPLTQEKQNESANGNSEGIPNARQGKDNMSHSALDSPVSDQQTLCKSRDSILVGSDILQIDSICSLLESDTSYNSQIAKIFNSLPCKKVEPQKSSLPNQQETGSREQKQQLDITENKDVDFQKDKSVQCTDVSHKMSGQSQSEQPSELSSSNSVEANRGIQKGSNLELTTKKEDMAADTSSATIEQVTYPQEIDSSSITGNHLARNEIYNEKTSDLYLHDQLSELLKEFPYGIEAVSAQEGSSVQQTGTDKISEDQTGDKTSSDSKDSTDQIQITILSPEEMKEIFSEQDDQPNDVDKLEEAQKEKPDTKVVNQCDSQEPPERESRESRILDSEKDDIHCCALGWLSMVYEGVPQCQCNTVKNLTSKEEKKQCSPLETNSCKQGERTSDEDISIVKFTSLSNNPKTTLTLPDGKSHFPEIKGNNTKDISETKPKGLKRTEQELTGESLSKSDKLDSSQNHKRKKPLQFHEVTFHSSNKSSASYEQTSHTLQKPHVAQNLRPLKPKTVFLTNKDLSKNGSVVQTSPEKAKMKFKADGLKQKHLEKRKLDQGDILDVELKKKKHDRQEPNKNVGDTLKLGNSLSNSNEKASVKEKTVSSTKSSDPKPSSSKLGRVLSTKEYFQRQKHKETMGNKVSRKMHGKNAPHDSEHMRARKLSVQGGSCGKLNERQSSVQSSKESSNGLASCGKNLKVYHSEESKSYSISKSIKEKVGGKQTDKIWIDKTKLDKKLSSINNDIQASQMPPQAKEQKKLYLNRVAFKCTERESICLTKFDGLPRKLNKDKEKRQENKPKTFLPVKEITEKPSMLEFKLCPDVLLKNANAGEERKDLKPHSRKEQGPVQVSGIKSTKEDWLKCVTTKKRIQEDNQEIDNVNSRLSKRSHSANGLEMLQNPVKDSKAMFQTYKQLYLEKRSRSLGNSPVK